MTISPMPNPPTRNDGHEQFVIKANDFCQGMVDFVPEANNLLFETNADQLSCAQSALNADTSAKIADASANFKGTWSAGTYTIPSSVYFEGQNYRLIVASSTQEPGTGNDWVNTRGRLTVDNLVVSNWELGTMDLQFWNSVVYGNDIYVAVAQLARSMYSSNGKDWTAAMMGGDVWNSVCFGDGKFVAVGADVTDGVRACVSTDGITWSYDSDLLIVQEWKSVIYGNNLFVAVAISGTDRVMTSTDGSQNSWTLRSSADDSNDWNAITYGNGIFVAVASSGTSRVQTSPDGITWTLRSSADDTKGWNAITYGNGLFVAVANTGTGNRVMTSPDGITWTLRSSADDSNSWEAICYSEAMNMFLATCISRINNVMTSTNGKNWTLRSNGKSEYWRGVCYSEEKGNFVAVAAETSAISMNYPM